MEPALEREGETRPIFEILRSLATSLELADFFPWGSAEEVLDAILDHPTTGNATVASLRAAGGFVPLKVPAIAYADRKFDSPSGKVEFYSSQAERLGLPTLPVHKMDKATPYPLALSFGRTLTHFQDWIANRVRAKKALVLIDACEAGALIAGHTSSRTSMALSEAAIGRLHEATGRPVLTATAAGQFAVEGYNGHGVFTFAVLDALRHADSNGNGTIELSELATHVQSLVPKLAPELDDPTIQQPRFGSRGEDFVIAGRLDD